MRVNVSNGEIIDKITILRIKQFKISDPNKLKNINTELGYLSSLLPIIMKEIDQIHYNELYACNLQLWEIEDKIRNKEFKKEFDNEFIELARSVYFTNDKRAKIKNIINTLSSSELIEEKQYIKYE